MKHLFAVAACALGLTAGAQEAGVRFTEYVNPFIGTTNFGTLRPLLPDGTFLTPFDPDRGRISNLRPAFTREMHGTIPSMCPTTSLAS